MATSEILGLFQSPDQYRAAQEAAMQQQFARNAQLAPLDRARMLYQQAGYQAGQGIGGALGGVDPQLQKITQRQQILGMIDPANPDSYARGIQAALQVGDQEAAFLLRNEMMQAQQQALSTRKTTAEAQKAELSLSQEQKLRDELSKLSSGATEEDVLAIVTKYGSADKVLTALQQSSSKRAQIEARAAEKEKELEYKRERDLEKAADQKARDEAQREFLREMAKLNNDTKESLARLAGSLKPAPAPALTTIVNPENPNETITVDARIYKGGGKNAAGVIGAGKPSATQEKATLLKQQLSKDLDFAINELTEVTKDGGLIDKSTGSGAGRLVDLGAAFVGTATPGAIAIGQLKPIQDLVLKMVPRFEGPQSDKDTQSYKEAAGQLADPTLPTETRKAAGKTVLRLMKERKNQFVTPELASEGIGASPSTVQMTKEDQQALDWANSNPNDPRSSQIKSRLGVR
jgi:hypothetical protein